MSTWVIINKEWLLRPLQDGLELLTPERNIALELSEPERWNEITSILLGEQEISTVEEESIRETIEDLAKRGVLRYVNYKPTHIKRTEIEEKIWKLRKSTVGSQGPIYEVYWLNPNQSQFSPGKVYLFNAKYLEGTKNIAWAFANDRKDSDLAELKAIMEALERHACSVVPFAELIKTSANKLGESAINPSQVVSYTRRQYKHNPSLIPFSDEKKYYWKEVITFPQEEKRYLLAECLYFPLRQSVFSHPYTFANSSGVAAGFKFEEVLLSGLYEAIERDAFMIVWLKRIIMPTIQKVSLPEDIKSRIEKIEELGYQVFLTDITLDLAPVVLVLVVGYQREPALILGTASNLDILKACSKALTEVEQQLYWNLRSSTTPDILLDYKKVRRVSDHAALYHTSRHLSKASFLWSGNIRPLQVSQEKIDDELEKVLNIFSSRKIQIVVANLTPPFLKKVGVQVLRTIPLGLVPISFGYNMEPLGMLRLKRSPKEITHLKQSPWTNNIPFTHPFA